MADARRLIAAGETDQQTTLERVDAVLELLERADELYAAAKGDQRRWLNHALFERFEIDVEDDGDQPRA